MFKFIINFLLFKITIAQIHLTKDNLNQVCNCVSSAALTWIDLSYKNITTIDPYTFNGLNSLQRIMLHNNQLIRIEPSTFTALISLQLLWLSSNQIATIDPSTFRGLNSLYYRL